MDLAEGLLLDTDLLADLILDILLLALALALLGLGLILLLALLLDPARPASHRSSLFPGGTGCAGLRVYVSMCGCLRVDVCSRVDACARVDVCARVCVCRRGSVRSHGREEPRLAVNL